METFLSLIYGASMKITDELIDVPNNYVNLKSFFQLLTISLYSILSYNDYLFSCIALFITIGSYYAGSLDDPYWINCAYIIGIIFILSIINKRESILSEIGDFLPIILGSVLLLFLICAVDNYLFPKENDMNKIISTIFFLVASIIIYKILNTYIGDFPFLHSYVKYSLWAIGYFIIRFIVKLYLYNTTINNAEIEISKEETL
jgi:hypothetical protein